MLHPWSDFFLRLESLSPHLWPLAALILALLASPHCLLMCGPVCFLASNQDKKRLSVYHLGRLVSYLSLGMLFGWFGQVFLRETQQGLLVFLATLFGAGLIASGFFLLFTKRLAPTPEYFNKFVSRILKSTLDRAVLFRSLILGMMSGLLPCGLLYSFVLMAATTKSVVFGGLFLFAFWLGTVPALSFATQFSQKFFFAQRTETQAKLRLIMASLFVIYGTTILYNRIQLADPGQKEKVATAICGTPSSQRINK